MLENHHYRMVALKLHGIHPKDRRWLLGHFAPDQQATLDQLIKELDSLGLVPTEKISTQLTAYPVGDLRLDAHDVAIINQAEVEAVRRALNGLSDRLKAMIFHASSWQWSAAVWLSLEQQERDRLLRHVGACQIIKAPVFSAVISAVASELGGHSLVAQAGRSAPLSAQFNTVDA